jgi:hypothetical protein
VLVVDELQVHVHEHGVQDQGQLVPVDVQRALNKLFQVAKIKNERQPITLLTEMNCAILNIYCTVPLALLIHVGTGTVPTVSN